MRRAVVSWMLAIVLLTGGVAAGIVALNATVLGSAGFVRVYLDALARGDAAGALSLPGVAVDDDDRTDFLVDAALPGLFVTSTSTSAGPDGTELVAVGWRSAGEEGTTTFTVARVGSRLGVFPEWAFAVSPVATLRLVVENDERFELGGIPAVSGVAAADPVGYALLVPGVYRVDHRSAYLRADALDLAVHRPSSEVGATLAVEPSEAFVDEVEAQVHALLDGCAAQDVLFPTACPLGHGVANRVISPPVWSIVEYPEVDLEPGAEFGTWVVPPTEAVSHLRVDIQTLFDGAVTEFDEDLPITVSYRVVILADDATLRIEPLA